MIFNNKFFTPKKKKQKTKPPVKPFSSLLFHNPKYKPNKRDNKLRHTDPFGDFDGDGVINSKDCKPYNKKRTMTGRLPPYITRKPLGNFNFFTGSGKSVGRPRIDPKFNAPKPSIESLQPSPAEAVPAEAAQAPPETIRGAIPAGTDIAKVIENMTPEELASFKKDYPEYFVQ